MEKAEEVLMSEETFLFGTCFRCLGVKKWEKSMRKRVELVGFAASSKLIKEMFEP